MSNPNKIKAGNLHQTAPETAPPTAPRLNQLKARLNSWIDDTRDMPINQVVQELLRDCKSALEEQERTIRGLNATLELLTQRLEAADNQRAEALQLLRYYRYSSNLDKIEKLLNQRP